jgi:hypothetical protein
MPSIRLRPTAFHMKRPPRDARGVARFREKRPEGRNAPPQRGKYVGASG